MQDIEELVEELKILDLLASEINARANDLRKRTAAAIKALSEINKTLPEKEENSWLSPQQAADYFGISRQTVDRRLKEMEELGQRYNGCIIRESKCVRVQLRAFDDYEKSREMLTDPHTRKYVPAFFRHI